VSFVVKGGCFFWLIASCYLLATLFVKDRMPQAHFNLWPNTAFYHLFAHEVNEKTNGIIPALRTNREGQRSRLMIFWYFEMDSLQQDSPMTGMSRDPGDLPIPFGSPTPFPARTKYVY
jgi:hypothetical protein